MAPVRRELVLPPSERQPSNVAPAGSNGGRVQTIDDLPMSGRLTMYPQYVVAVSVKLNDTDKETSSTKFGKKTMLPLNTELRLQARDSDYAYVECIQRQLPNLIAMPTSWLPRTVRIVGWDEVC